LLVAFSGCAVAQKKSGGASFSDLLGMSQKQTLAPKAGAPEKETAAKEEAPETKKESAAKPEVEKKSGGSDGIRMILGAAEATENRREYSDPSIPTLFKRPTMKSLGFPTPMSFLQVAATLKKHFYLCHR
jgi:hypothetical protein